MTDGGEPPKPKWPWILGGLLALISLATLGLVVVGMLGALFLVRREQQAIDTRRDQVHQQYRLADEQRRRAQFEAEEARRRAQLELEQAREAAQAAEQAEQARRAAEQAVRPGAVAGSS